MSMREYYCGYCGFRGVFPDHYREADCRVCGKRDELRWAQARLERWSRGDFLLSRGDFLLDPAEKLKETLNQLEAIKKLEELEELEERIKAEELRAANEARKKRPELHYPALRVYRRLIQPMRELHYELMVHAERHFKIATIKKMIREFEDAEERLTNRVQDAYGVTNLMEEYTEAVDYEITMEELNSRSY